MLNIDLWTEEFLQVLDRHFGSRVWFVGLQGSRGRDEATESSDIDMVVILDELTEEDLQVYDAMLDTLSHRELICGFLSGKAEILNWDPSDLFQFYHDTKPIRGSLDLLLPMLDDAAVRGAIRLGLCNIFHGCIHNMLHRKSNDALRELYKSASFVIQAICFRETGTYITRQADLLGHISPRDRIISETFLHLKAGGGVRFQEMSNALFTWAQTRIQEL